MRNIKFRNKFFIILNTSGYIFLLIYNFIFLIRNCESFGDFCYSIYHMISTIKNGRYICIDIFISNNKHTEVWYEQSGSFSISQILISKRNNRLYLAYALASDNKVKYDIYKNVFQQVQMWHVKHKNYVKCHGNILLNKKKEFTLLISQSPISSENIEYTAIQQSVFS